MKVGLGQFIYREISALAQRGAKVSLFPTKHRRGLYNPRPEWHVEQWSIWSVLLSQPLRLASMPFRYLSVLCEALRYGAIVEFLLAAHFAQRLKQVDVIYATFGDKKLFVGYFGKRLLNKQLAVELHADEMYQSPNSRLFQAALAACDRIITVTEYNRELLRDRFGVDPSRVDVVRLFVDLDEYRPQKKFVVLIVGYFAERKGHEILFRAIKQLARDDVEVWVVGDGGAEQQSVDVRKIAADLGVESQVAFFGTLGGTALKAVYHACDVFCLPCRVDSQGCAEGFPTVLIEAMACGKPVVTTHHVEIPRIVEQIIVAENDVAGLAAALERVYASSELRTRMGERNRELAEQHFASQNIERTFELLAQLAENTSADNRHSELPPSVANKPSAVASQDAPAIVPLRAEPEPAGAAP